MNKILIVDDEKSIRVTLADILDYEKYETEEAEDGLKAIAMLEKEQYKVVISDVKMPGMDGIQLLEEANKRNIKSQFIMLSAHANIDVAVEAIKKGAYNFIEKPPDLNSLLVSVRNALERYSLIEEAKKLRKQVYNIKPIIGNSCSIRLVKDMIDKVSITKARVLIIGPNGSGKELIAKWIHEKSERANKSMIEVNCAAIPSELIESELFGHEKGAFTSAIKQRIGKFEQANDSTLFLDEIGDMNLEAQAKVLRVIEQQELTRVGGNKTIKIDTRIIAATNKNLKYEIQNRRFREDLYHRISVIVISNPSLSERKEDIPILVDKFLSDIAYEYRQPKKNIKEECLQKLQTLEWPGNIRELRNVIERLVIMSDNSITLRDIENYL